MTAAVCQAQLISLLRDPAQVKSTGSSFEEKMAEDQKAMSNMMLGGSAAMIAAILVILIPLLATQPDA